MSPPRRRAPESDIDRSLTLLDTMELGRDAPPQRAGPHWHQLFGSPNNRLDRCSQYPATSITREARTELPHALTKLGCASESEFHLHQAELIPIAIYGIFPIDIPRTACHMLHMITANQIRAGRALLGWTRDKLARTSGIPMRTLARAEDPDGNPGRRTLESIETAFLDAGVEIVNGGVRQARAPHRTDTQRRSQT